MLPPPTSPRPPGRDRQAPRLACGRAELSFIWIGDRWQHRVSVGGLIVAESVEAGAEPRWPASPPLVDLSTATIAGRPTIVGIGLAGRAHFSAGILPHPVRPDTLLFEIACRLHEPPAWLGSTYGTGTALADLVRIAAATGGPDALPRTVQWSYTIGPDGVTPGTG
jgi:hypothetical protein